MTKLIRIRSTDVTIDRPVPYSIYDEGGKLLLRAGTAITIPRYLEALLSHGAFFDKAEVDHGKQAAANKSTDKPSVFEQTEKMLLNLRHIYTSFVTEPARIDLHKRIRLMAEQLMQLCGEDGDAVLAAAHLDQTTPYRIHHQLLCAVVVELTARTMPLPDEERLPLVCAALTHDIALIEAGDELEKVRTPLSLAQHTSVRNHPLRSAEILSGCGVDDVVWLDAVVQHHEYMDGSGYPHGMRGDKIGRGGRLLAIADAYGAMIRSRPYRGNALFPQNALREIFIRQRQYVSGLTQQVVRGIGMMPPGSIIRLASNEIGVVRARGTGSAGASVFAVYTPAGMPIFNPVRRDITNPAYAVAGKASYDECRSAEIIMRRLWMT